MMIHYKKNILKFYPALFAVAFLITSCSQEEMADISSPEKQQSIEFKENWNNADVELPNIEEVLQTARERFQEMNNIALRSSGGPVNGGFEDLDDSGNPVGWTYQVFFGGIDGDPSQGWIFGPTDPNGTDASTYDGMPHAEPLAHSGTNGASAVGNEPTVQALLSQPFTVPELSCPESSISLDFWIRWKNQAEQWITYQQDLQVVVFDDENDVIFRAEDENLPFYSGGGDFWEANYEQRTFDLSIFAGKTVSVIVYNIATAGFLLADLDDFCMTVVLCPDEALAALIADIEALVADGSLSSGHGNALTNKVKSALKQLDKGNIDSALGKLQAIIDQVNDLITNGHISAEDGQAIIDTVSIVIGQLS